MIIKLENFTRKFWKNEYKKQKEINNQLKKELKINKCILKDFENFLNNTIEYIDGVDIESVKSSVIDYKNIYDELKNIKYKYGENKKNDDIFLMEEDFIRGQ